MPPILACGYVRGSTADQVGTLTAQSEQIASYCDYRKLTLVYPEAELSPLACANPQSATRNPQCFIDSGTSAFSVPFYEREVASKMVTWMHDRGIRNLIITKLDRGFRNTLDCLFTIRDLAEKGIAVHILDIQLDTSTPVGKFVLTVMAAIAELENERRSERQKDVFRIRKAAGQRCGTIPYGWVLDPTDDSRLIPFEYEQDTLARLLTGDLSDVSANEASRRLNADGIPAKNGGRWFPATVAQLCKRNAKPLQQAA